MLKVIMVRGRKLNKVGDLEAQKQNVASLELTHAKQNVVPSELRIDESNNLCGLEFTMVTICNSNGEITRNTYSKFRSRNGGLIVLEFTYITLNANKKIVQIFLSLIISTTFIFHHLMEIIGFILSKKIIIILKSS